MAAANPAIAESTYLLQLGSFDTQQEATDKGNEIKTKNTDVVGTLTLHIAQVALPPDDKVTYRTQMGPVGSREQAGTLCTTLQARDVECYVVETAMFASESAPDQTDNGTRPTGASAAQPEAAASKPSEAATTPETTATKLSETATAQPEATAETTSTTAQPVPASITSSPLPALEHALAGDKPAKPVKVAAKEDTTHADDPDYIPPPVDSGPVIIASSQSSAPGAGSPSEVAELPVSSTATAQAPAKVPSPESVAEASPPPAPPSAPAPAPAVTEIASAEPAPAPEAKKPGFFSRLFGSSPPKATSAEGVTGSVNVAEAVRVPLSSEQELPRQKIVPVMPASLNTSSAEANPATKTIWAQISYFRNESQALTFYRQFNTHYPQFTHGVRIRTTRPFATATAERVTLRVGPFYGTDDVRSICYLASLWKARCTLVRDIGATTTVAAATSGSMPTPRSAHARATARAINPAELSPSADAAELYWAQLGTFRSQDEAWDAWRELESNHGKILKHVKPAVTAPASSSAAGGTFRLRAGPLNLSNAGNLCGRLQTAGLDCIIVGAGR